METAGKTPRRRNCRTCGRKAADIIRAQLDNDTVYLKFPNSAELSRAAEELLKKLKVFQIGEIRERYNSLQMSTTACGTLAVRFLKK